MPNQTDEEWRETVEKIYSLMRFDDLGLSGSGHHLAMKVVSLIEERHPFIDDGDKEPDDA